MKFDTPFEVCPVCNQYVMLDQAQRECAREHGCARDRQCPLERYFTGREFEESALPKRQTGTA